VHNGAHARTGDYPTPGIGGGDGIGGGEGIAGGDGMSGAGGTSTVPSPVVVVGNSGDGTAGGATVVSTVDVWTELVSDVSDVVELVVVSSSALSLPHAVNSDATAIPEARANRADLGALREVTQPRLPAAAGAQPSALSRARLFRP
jgi:hypothetical protein